MLHKFMAKDRNMLLTVSAASVFVFMFQLVAKSFKPTVYLVEVVGLSCLVYLAFKLLPKPGMKSYLIFGSVFSVLTVIYVLVEMFTPVTWSFAIVSWGAYLFAGVFVCGATALVFLAWRELVSYLPFIWLLGLNVFLLYLPLTAEIFANELVELGYLGLTILVGFLPVFLRKQVKD